MASETFTPGQMELEGPFKTRAVTILAGADVVKGAVLGIVTASGKYQLSASAAIDGSQTPVAIAAHDIEASAADGVGSVYFMGTFDDAKLTYGAGHDASTVDAAFAAAGAPLDVKTL